MKVEDMKENDFCTSIFCKCILQFIFCTIRDSKIQILECIYKKVEYHFLAMNLPYVRENQHRYEEPTFDLY